MKDLLKFSLEQLISMVPLFQFTASLHFRWRSQLDPQMSIVLAAHLFPLELESHSISIRCCERVSDERDLEWSF